MLFRSNNIKKYYSNLIIQYNNLIYKIDENNLNFKSNINISNKIMNLYGKNINNELNDINIKLNNLKCFFSNEHIIDKYLTIHNINYSGKLNDKIIYLFDKSITETHINTILNMNDITAEILFKYYIHIQKNFIFRLLPININKYINSGEEPPETIEYIVENLTEKEEGVRNLKRCLEIIYTKINLFRFMKPESDLFGKDMSLNIEFPITVDKELVDKLIKKEDKSKGYLNMYL